MISDPITSIKAKNRPFVSSLAISGSFWLIFSQVIFLVCGYFINIGLGNILGPDDFGIYYLIITFFLDVEIFLRSGGPTAISKLISEIDSNTEIIAFSGIAVQLFFGVILSILVFILAPFISSSMNDRSLEVFIIAGSALLPIYAAYYGIIGVFNGTQRFRLQSLAIILYSLSKVFLVFTLTYLAGFSPIGAVIGFIMAPLVPVLILITRIKLKIRLDKQFMVNTVKNFLPITLYSLITTLITSIDIYFVKATSSADMANYLTGIYSAATVIAKIGLLSIIPITNALFPLVSNLNSTGKKRENSNLIKETYKVINRFYLPISCVMLFIAEFILGILYPNYIEGAFILKLLFLAMVLFGMYKFLANTFIAQGRVRLVVVVSLSLLIIIFFLLLIFSSFGIVQIAVISLLVSFLGYILLILIFYNDTKVFLLDKEMLSIHLITLFLFLNAFFSISDMITFILALFLALYILFALYVTVKKIKNRIQATNI